MKLGMQGLRGISAVGCNDQADLTRPTVIYRTSCALKFSFQSPATFAASASASHQLGKMRRHFDAISLYTFLFLLSSSPRPIQGLSQTLRNDGVRRSLLSFKETIGNSSFQCSPSGPCLACQYSEKNDEKYRCSETGYRVPLKCVETGDISKEANSKKYRKRLSSMEDDTKFSSDDNPKLNTAIVNARKLAFSARNFRWRRLLDPSFTVEGGKKTYITYRSCIPPVGEEKLGVLGFEGIMVCLLLISGTVIYFRRKRTAAMPGSGAVRIQTNSRF